MRIRVVLDGDRYVYYDAPSESGMGSDHYHYLPRPGVPSVLLLTKKIKRYKNVRNQNPVADIFRVIVCR